MPGDGFYLMMRSRIVCTDGFVLSVIAGEATYCAPRMDNVEWTAVEVGVLSDKFLPIKEWEEYSDDPEDTSSFVYAYVPLELVEKLIADHGGIKEGELFWPYSENSPKQEFYSFRKK